LWRGISRRLPVRPDGVAHAPVLVRGRFYGDVWIDAEITGADQLHMVRLGFAPRP